MDSSPSIQVDGERTMRELHRLSTSERELFFRDASLELNIQFPIIEKDFWVVWTLERLFAIDDLKSHLTFKGGTSLSKVYGLIERFSEDIDVSIEKDFLGFQAEDKDPDKAKTKNKQRAALEALSSACASYVQNEMATALKEKIADSLGTTKGWNLLPDDKDSQALVFEYPNYSARRLHPSGR